jgi:hypothetical protein
MHWLRGFGELESGGETAMAYTRDGIMAQIYVAFGQGTGTVRVSQDVCIALRDHYQGRITDEVIDRWEILAVQVLERFRALGRLMAVNASTTGSTSIAGGDVETSADIVERQSETELCRPPSLSRSGP